MKRRGSLLCNLALALGCATSAAAADNDFHVTTYNMIAKGFKVGHVRTDRSRVQREGKDLLRCTVSMSVNVRIPFLKYTLLSEEVYFSDARGAVSYHHLKIENGHTMVTDGVRKKDVFHIRVQEGGTNRVLDIPMKDFICTSLDNAESRLATLGDKESMRILDLVDVMVVDRHYAWVKSEKMHMGDEKVLCRVIDFNDQNRKVRRWITEDDLGVVIARQDGHEKVGAYSMRFSDAGLPAEPSFKNIPLAVISLQSAE